MTISLNDLNILDSIVLEIKTHNYKMKQGSIPIALIYKIHYKAMNSAFGTKYKLQQTRGVNSEGEPIYNELEETF